MKRADGFTQIWALYCAALALVALACAGGRLAPRAAGWRPLARLWARLTWPIRTGGK